MYQHGCVDALPRQRVNVPSGVPNDEQVVIVGGLEALRPQPQRRRPHALNLGFRPQGRADEGVVPDGSLVQPLQILLLQHIAR